MSNSKRVNPAKKTMQPRNVKKVIRTKLDNASRKIKGYFQRCKDDVKSLSFWRAAIFEFIGAMILTLFGCGAWTSKNQDPEFLLHRISLSFGSIYGIMAYIMEPKYCALMNPAMTLSMLVASRINILRAVVYLIAQIEQYYLKNTKEKSSSVKVMLQPIL